MKWKENKTEFNETFSISYCFDCQPIVNLPQSMAPNPANAGGNPIQNMSAMSNPMGMTMNSHGAMMSTTTVMVSATTSYFMPKRETVI